MKKPFQMFSSFTNRSIIIIIVSAIVKTIIVIINVIIIVSITKFSIVIGSPRAYLSRNRRAITWVSN